MFKLFSLKREVRRERFFKHFFLQLIVGRWSGVELKDERTVLVHWAYCPVPSDFDSPVPSDFDDANLRYLMTKRLPTSKDKLRDKSGIATQSIFRNLLLFLYEVLNQRVLPLADATERQATVEFMNKFM